MGFSTTPTAPTTTLSSVSSDYSSPDNDPRCEDSDSESEGQLTHHKVKVSALTESGEIVDTEKLRAAKRAEDLRNARAKDDASFLGNAAFIVGFGTVVCIAGLAIEHAVKFYCDKMGCE